MKLLSRFVRSTTGKVAIGVLVGTLISVPTAVLAVTSFSDVSTSHPFYKEISAVAGAGIAQGFDDGTYRPANNITRQAMAAFLERGLGRAVSAFGTIYVIPADFKEVASVSMDAGATGSGTGGFVRVSGTLWASTSTATTAGCPCDVQVILYDGNQIVAQGYVQVPQLPDGENALGSAALETVLPVDGDSAHLYRLHARGYNTFGEETVSAAGSITATYFPLSGDGDNTATYELTCPKDDAREQNDSSLFASSFPFTGTAFAIVCPSDEDWYSDFVAASSTITVDVSFNNAEGNIDVCLYRAGMAVTCSLGTSSGLESMSYPAALADTYSIVVFLAEDHGSVPGNTYSVTASK